MDFIMTVEDSFLAQCKGVVVSGANERLDSMLREDIRKIIGTAVCVSHGGEDRLFDVLDVAFSESLAGKRNVSILLESSDEAFFTRGDGVFAVESCEGA